MYYIFIAVTILTFSLVDIFCYLRIYLQTKRIEMQIAIIQTKAFSGGNARRPKSESKVAQVTGMILLNVFLCYIPLLGCFLYEAFTGEMSRGSHHILYWAALPALLNSLLNPVISCMQLSVIRNAVLSRNTETKTSVIQIRTL